MPAGVVVVVPDGLPPPDPPPDDEQLETPMPRKIAIKAHRTLRLRRHTGGTSNKPSTRIGLCHDLAVEPATAGDRVAAD